MHSFFDPSPLWTEQIRICSYDVDFTRRATLASLCRYFLEAAWNHAESLGVGFNYLQNQQKFWVLSRLLMELERPPAWGSPVTVRTWPRQVRSVFAMRDFEFLDSAGMRVVAGSSAWLVLDAVSKRPQRLEKLLPGLEDWGDDTALGENPQKLGDLETWDAVTPVTVRYSDIDVNRHVNSSRYIGWILDTYSLQFHGEHSVRSFEINYLGETLEGDVLSVRSGQFMEGVFFHSLVKPDGNTVCRARLEWTHSPAA